MTIICRNIKINIKLKRSPNFFLLHEKEADVEQKKTSFTIRPHSLDCVITIYKHSTRSLHITGIKSSSTVNNTFEFLTNVLRAEIISSKVNNSMFSGKLNKHVDISKVIQKVERKMPSYSCSFIEEIFPAAFIKPNLSHKKLGVPTTILFPNGSFIIMGGTDIRKIKGAHMLLTSLIE